MCFHTLVFFAKIGTGHAELQKPFYQSESFGRARLFVQSKIGIVLVQALALDRRFVVRVLLPCWCWSRDDSMSCEG